MNVKITDERESGTMTLMIDEDSKKALEGFLGKNGEEAGNESGASL